MTEFERDQMSRPPRGMDPVADLECQITELCETIHELRQQNAALGGRWFRLVVEYKRLRKRLNEAGQGIEEGGQN